VGELQLLQFLLHDVGPCWTTPAEREATRKDRPSGKMKRTQQKAVNLKKDLQAKGVLGMGDKKELQRVLKKRRTY
jgi:hypothetical protein